MKTLNPYSSSFQSQLTEPTTTTSSSKKQGHHFWGINLSNIPSTITDSEISADFKQYGDIFSIKSVSTNSINIIFSSPKQSNTINDIVSQQTKFKVTPLESKQLPARSKKTSVAKLNLCGSSTTTKSAYKFNPKLSKLSSKAAPFTAPSRSGKFSKSVTLKASSSCPLPSDREESEGIIFEAVCKSISHGTKEEEILDFIKANIYSSIKTETVKDGMMMLPGESMAVFELNDAKAIAVLTEYIEKMNANLSFNGNKFSLKRKCDGVDKSLSVRLEDVEVAQADERRINSNGVNVINEENGVDYLMGIGFQHGIKSSTDDDDKKQGDEKKNFYFKLPQDAKQYISKQAVSLGVPKTAFCLQLTVLTTNGPISVSHYRAYKQSKKNKTTSDIVPNMDNLTDASDKSMVSSKLGETSKNSPVGSTSTTLFDTASSTNSKPSPNAYAPSKKIKNVSKKSVPTSSIKRAPLVSTGSFSDLKAERHEQQQLNNQQTTNKRMFQYPQNSALGTSSLFAQSSNGTLNGANNLFQGLNTGNNLNNTLSLISPRGVNLIQMKSTGNTLLSPTAASILSPRRINGNAGSVQVPNNVNVGNGFSMTTPIANLTPVHIPFLGANNGQNGQNQNAQSPMNSGFQSPVNFGINTPQSPLGNYSGITPIINAFTPTANGVNAITPTTNLPFYWSNNANLQQQQQPQTNNHMGGMSMDNDPLAPNNMQNMFNPPQSSNPYVQNNLLRVPTLNQQQQHNQQQGNGQQSAMSNQPSTFFKYPIPSDNEPIQRVSPRNNNMQAFMQQQHQQQQQDGNGWQQQQQQMQCDRDEDEQQMDERPSMDGINNMRSIPSVISPNGTTPVVMITNLNEDEIDCDKIFTLCGVFGDVQRVKISYHKRDTAFVQLANHRQAKHVVTSLNRMQLYGKMIHVNLSRMTRVKLPKDSPNSAMMFPDAKFLTKDYTNCKRHRYSKKGAGGIKYSPLSIGQPSHILHIANLPIQSEAKDLQEYLSGSHQKISSIELIGVNNKLGSCQAFAKCHSVDIACQILIDFHSREFLGREIKISFATRSHMPSDINKTHKTYSYSTDRKVGSSINSIPSSIHGQQQQQQQQHNGSQDNVSSSSSSNGYHSNQQQQSNGYSNQQQQQQQQQLGQYNGQSHQVNPMFPKHLVQDNGSGYMQQNGYGDGGYNTYNVVNNEDKQQQQQQQHSDEQDKIFVRQHHHSGGRKYHYKLRINK